MTGGEVVILPMGNIGSIRRALERLGAAPVVTDDPARAAACARLVAPGVGHFGAYVRGLRARGLDRVILDRLRAGRDVLGVCAGMQALTLGSEEAPDEPGLGWLPVRCAALREDRRPAFGWTEVRGAGGEGYASFVHSYAAVPAGDDAGSMLASHDGGAPFLAGIWKDGLLATQFHPEKSHTYGMELLAAWLRGDRPSACAESLRPRRGLAKRIIACLDVMNGELVKGEQFVNLSRHGDPAEAAERYETQGADEIVALDITASVEARPALLDCVRRIADRLSIPFTVGGGVRTLEDASALFDAGADKVTVNSAAVERPEVISEIADRYGSQAVVIAIDAKRRGEGWIVTTHGGRRETSLQAVAWAVEATERGAGESLLTSMDRDGARSGYDTALLSAVSRRLAAPVVASGGFGAPRDAASAFEAGADAALLAGCLHRGETTIAEIKQRMRQCGVEVRPC